MPAGATARVASSAYRSYLVRFWQSNEQGAWRASAQCVQTGNTLRFGDVENLLAFLHAETSGNPNAGQNGSSSGSSEAS